VLSPDKPLPDSVARIVSFRSELRDLQTRVIAGRWVYATFGGRSVEKLFPEKAPTLGSLFDAGLIVYCSPTKTGPVVLLELDKLSHHPPPDDLAYHFRYRVGSGDFQEGHGHHGLTGTYIRLVDFQLDTLLENDGNTLRVELPLPQHSGVRLPDIHALDFDLTGARQALALTDDTCGGAD